MTWHVEWIRIPSQIMVDLIGLPKSRDNQFWLLDVIVDDGLDTDYVGYFLLKKERNIFSKENWFG